MDTVDVLSHWELGAIAAIEEVLTGSVNRVFRVRARRGTFYLRIYKLADRLTVEREHALIAHVAAAELPAIGPVVNNAGATIVPAGERIASLFPEAVGEQIAKRDLSREHAALAGEMLARLHRCTAALPDAGYRSYQLRWPTQKWIERLAVIADAVSARAHRSSADEQVLQRLEAQRAWLANPRCAHAHQPVFAAQVTHGDYQHTNLFFAPGRVSGIIDWEQALYMPRAFEVARAVAYMFDLERSATRSFLAAYRSATSMSDDELHDGVRAWGCMSDHYVWALEEVYLHGNERARPFIPSGFRPFEAAWDEATA
jgi:homoserine kinase type II